MVAGEGFPGARIGSRFSFTEFGAWGRLVSEAPTLGQACAVAAHRVDGGGFSGGIFTDTGGGITFNLYTNPQEDVSNGIRHIPMGVPIMAASAAYMKDLIKYPPQFKIGFMSNNPPVYDLLPQMQKMHQENIEKQGAGRPTP